jgi:hypothetical protein
MTNLHLQKLWSAVGAILLFYSLNALSQDRGGALLFKLVLLDERKAPNAYFSIIVIGVLLTLLAAIGRLYVKQSLGQPAFGRWPVVWLSELDTAKTTGKLYQAFFLAIFIAIPLFCLAHFWKEMTSDGALYWKDTFTVEVSREQALAGALSAMSLQRGVGAKTPDERILLNSMYSIAIAAKPGEHWCIADNQGGNHAFLGGAIRFRLIEEAKTFDVDPVRIGHGPCKDTAKKTWLGGVTWVPVVSPALLFGLSATSVAALIAFLGALFSTPKAGASNA